MSDQLDYVDRIEEHLDALVQEGINPVGYGTWLLKRQCENDIAKLQVIYPGYVEEEVK